MDEQHPQDNQEHVDLDELVKRDVAVICGKRGYVDSTGKLDRDTIADVLEPIMKAAEVNVPGDRAKMTEWAHELTAATFPGEPGPASWIEQSNPLRAEKVWEKLRGEVTRTLSTDPKGVLQRRLASNGGLVLCEVQTKPKGGDRGFYTTRNPKCIAEDLHTPARKSAARANDKLAALNEMTIERVPEHVRKFEREFAAAQKAITEGPQRRVAGAVEAVTSDPDAAQSGGTDDGE